MRILAIVPSIYDTSPGQRFRIEQWESILAENGVQITYAPFENEELHSVLYKSGATLPKVKAVIDSMLRRRRGLSGAKDFDLIYIFREAALLGPPWFERAIAKLGPPVVFDFDDAVFVSYRSPSNGYLSYLKFPAKTAEICRLSTHVMAGNEYLAEYARKVNPNVTIIPTTIDTEKYKLVPKNREGEKVTVGWSGSFSTIQHLNTIRGPLQKLAQEEEFRLRVIGDPTFTITHVDTESFKWQASTELEDLGAIDIGLMPLPDENWTKGKCGLKALQYMALGVPTICSPVGVNSTIIQDGVNGFLAGNDEEWIDKIKLLIHSPDLRRRLGNAGRETVERDYSATAIAPRVLQIFQEAVAAKAKKI